MIIIVFIASLCLGLVSSIWKAYVLTCLWAWFLVPTFAFPVLKLVPAMGLVLTIGFLTYQLDAQKKKETNSIEAHDMFVAFAFNIIFPSFALFWGWLFKQYM